MRKVGRALIGSHAERHYRKAVQASGSDSLYLKDPFCLFISPYMIERFDARVAVSFRHPGAQLVSMRRMGWTPSIKSLIEQPGLIEQYCPEYDAFEIEERSASDDVFANAVFWVVAWRFTQDILRRFPENVIVLRHEALSLGSALSVEKLVSHFKLDAGKDASMAYQEKRLWARLLCLTAACCTVSRAMVRRWRHIGRKSSVVSKSPDCWTLCLKNCRNLNRA